VNFFKPINLPDISITPISIGVGVFLGLFVSYCYSRYYISSGGAAGISKSLMRTWMHVILSGAIPFILFFVTKLFLAASDRLTQGNLFIAEMISSLMWAGVIFYLSVKEYFVQKKRAGDTEEHPE
jgi:Ni,Fe-hydrogenase I cytochrome b subunit